MAVQCDARSTVTFSAYAGIHRVYPQRDGQAELTWVVGFEPRHFGTNRAQSNVAARPVRCRYAKPKFDATPKWFYSCSVYLTKMLFFYC